VQLLQEKDGLQAQFGKLAMVVDDRKVSPQKCCGTGTGTGTVGTVTF
jgi:hypothetical protein